MGALQVFVFGSFVRASYVPIQTSIWPYRGLPARAYFSAVSKASDLLGRPVDLLDLDEETPLVRHLLRSGEFIRVD